MGGITDTRILISLGAIFAGWGAGFLSVLAYAALVYGEPTHFPSMFFVPGAFIFLGWILIFLPLLRWVPAKHPLFKPRIFPIAGALLGMAAFYAWISWWWEGFRRFAHYPLYAVVAGGVAAAVYAFANQALLRRAATEET
jgi:hypothetical protein